MKVTMTYVERSDRAPNGLLLGEEPEHEAFTNKRSELFRFCQREYGRCTSSMYIDTVTCSEPLKVGWVFEKTEKYSDCDDTYIRETWVEYVGGL